MVSALWKACSDGHLESVHELLNDPSGIDIEITDHNGATPLVQAVRNGHIEVVKALLDKGADLTHATNQGLPEQYTSDPAILELLRRASNKLAPGEMPSQEQGYPHDPIADTEKRYYAPHPIAYAYYPGMNPGIPPMHDGAMYYPPHPAVSTGEHQVPGAPPNLPPPEVARLIPCRFFPACRYGASCLFAHPQGPYFSGPLPPPAQYPAPYDPMMAPAYPPNYYPVPPPSFQPTPNGVHPHMTPTSPQAGVHHTPSLGHARSGSEIILHGHFNSPRGPAYGVMPPVSPTYPHPGQVPVPLPIPPPPLPHQQSPPGPQSPQSLYNNTSPPPFVVRPDAAASAAVPFPPQAPNPHQTYGEVNGGPKSPPLRAQPENYASGGGPAYRESAGHNRRGSTRRGSFGGRKPPCLFYPSGRCKNGDDCRFPHVIPEGSNPPSGYYPGRSGPRPRNGHVNGFGAIEERLEDMTLKDARQSRATNGADGSSRSHSTEAGSRGRHSHGSKTHHAVNGTRGEKRGPAKQRVPNADDFPVLGGSITPPLRNAGVNGVTVNGHGHTGPTAAQVLQAPAPLRKENAKESSTRNASPDAGKDPKPTEANGTVSDASRESPPIKHPSFAAVANAAPEIVKDVSYV